MKNKLFPLISILVLVILFGIAATCNMCGLNLSTENSTSITEETETDKNLVETSDAEETTKITTAADITKEETKEATKSNSTDSQAVAPTIELKVHVGPLYSQSDQLCHYTIEAIITGEPSPTVEFSRDDSNGGEGKYKVEIGVKINESYNLTAKAKNSVGEATATLDLSPEVIDRNLHPTIIGTVGPAGYVEKDTLKIGDSPFNSDWRGRFAFNVSSLVGKQIMFVLLELDSPNEYGNPCNFKGDIAIFYNDFLPDLTADDYYSAAYAGPETFACNADPLQVHSDFLFDKILERAEANTELQFGIGYTNTASNNDNNFDGREYLLVTLEVVYLE